MSRESTKSLQNASASLQFISVTEASYRHGQKPQQHPDVRRHVMLGRRRRERLAATQEFQQRQIQDSAIRVEESTRLSASAANADVDELGSQKTGRDTREKRNDSVIESHLALARQHPAGWRLDPFESFAAPLDKHVQAGLEYCEYIAFIHAIRPGWACGSSGMPVSMIPSHEDARLGPGAALRLRKLQKSHTTSNKAVGTFQVFARPFIQPSLWTKSSTPSR
jgi:hypothetical protein